MFVLKGCKYSKNVVSIYRDGSPHMVDLVCAAASDIYHDPDGKKGRFMDLDVFDFVREVHELERFVESSYNDKLPLVFPTTGTGLTVLKRVKLPCRYGHVMVHIEDRDGSKLTTYDVKKGMFLRVALQAKSAWCSDTHCGISWVVHSIKTT